MKSVINALLYIVLSLLSILLTGFTISVLWGWFVVPLGVTPIGMANAFGLSVMIMFFKIRGRKDFVKDVLVEKSETRKWIEHFATPITALLFGWLTTLFM